MNLTDYVRPLPEAERIALAQRAGTTWNQLRNMSFSGKRCGPRLAAAIERATGGEVKRWDLRPDDWHEIWPELVGAVGAPSVPADASVA
jgi:DNA-binding transcriptional regulator YdaS (Cro superfamily)